MQFVQDIACVRACELMRECAHKLFAQAHATSLSECVDKPNICSLNNTNESNICSQFGTTKLDVFPLSTSHNSSLSSKILLTITALFIAIAMCALMSTAGVQTALAVEGSIGTQTGDVFTESALATENIGDVQTNVAPGAPVHVPNVGVDT